MTRPSLPKIGISACFLYPDAQREAFGPKTLQYLEQSMAHWVMSGGGLPVMIPSPMGKTARGDISFADYAQWLDGLVLHGGSDVWPGSYGETPAGPEWSGDKNRDEYEIALLNAFVAAGKPVFGICRGLQLINVAFGGTLYQDIPTQHPKAMDHCFEEAYDDNYHGVEVVPHTRLHALLGDARGLVINSIHHQGIKDLAPAFVVEALCPQDGMIESIRYAGTAPDTPYVAAVQWHPEFRSTYPYSLDDQPLLQDFLQAARAASAA